MVRKPLQRFQLVNDLCYEKVMVVGGKHQVLIFVHSRKETAKTTRAIRDTTLANNTLGRFLKEDSASREILHTHTNLVKSNDLKDLVPYGFAIHHAGLTRADRQLVEDLFADGHIQVLVSTATLAWGVNLPAHSVIIKGTQIYNQEKGAWTKLSALDVMQMLSHAGRPQYDSYNTFSLINQQLPIESQFVSKLADQLNTEIVLGTVQNAREACNWLGYTYLYVRMLRNPTLYGLEADVLTRDITLEERRADLMHISCIQYFYLCAGLSVFYLCTHVVCNFLRIHSATIILDKNNLIKYDRKSGYFQVRDLSLIASYYYITHGTISTYNEHLKPTMGDTKLCCLLSLGEEFKYVTVRQDEKMELAKLLDRVPIPIKESLEEPSAKINVLLQAYISQLKLEGLSLTSDMVYITQIVLKRGWAQLAEKALNLCKMVTKRMWSVQTPLRQFNGISNDILMKLEKDLAWERYYDLSSQELGELIRAPKIGRMLHKFIHQFPKLNFAAHVQPITRTVLMVELSIKPDFQWEDKVHAYVEPFWVIVEDNDGEYILYHEYFMLKKQFIEDDHTLNFTTMLPISFRHLILPEKYPPPTELLDLQPLPVFTVLYNLDDNVLVATPTGSRKTFCVEFAILRNHQKGHDNVMRVVYIAHVEALSKERYCDWERKFGKDLKLLEKGQIIISTPERWDALSRYWKIRKQIQEVSLFIVDELHLLGVQGGPILEVIVENKICFVALSTSLANAKDLGEWIGATLHGLFNFPLGVHPVPLEIHIHGVDIANFEARMQATYTVIVQHAKNGKPYLVYVLTRKHVQLIALDLMIYSSVDGGESLPFLLCPLDDIEPFVDRIDDEMLKDTPHYGVSYLHEGLSSFDQEVVDK
ncbi:hypothetical protein UlMin_031993 [Ulmus minor]